MKHHHINMFYSSSSSSSSSVVGMILLFLSVYISSNDTSKTVVMAQGLGAPYSICYKKPDNDDDDDDMIRMSALEMCQSVPDCGIEDDDDDEDNDVKKLTYQCYMRCDSLDHYTITFHCQKYGMECVSDLHCVVPPSNFGQDEINQDDEFDDDDDNDDGDDIGDDDAFDENIDDLELYAELKNDEPQNDDISIINNRHHHHHGGEEKNNYLLRRLRDRPTF